MHDIEGRIEDRSLVEVLLSVARRRGSGILTVQGEHDIIGLSFLDGALVSADALNQSLEEGLGRILAGRDLVSPEILANLSAEHHAGGGRVVDLLVERNYLSREELCDGLRENAYELCQQALRWTQGEFKFYLGDEVAFEEGVVAVPVDELIVRAAEAIGSEALLDASLPGAETIFARVDRLDDELSPDTLGELLAPGLATPEPGDEIFALLDRVDGQRTVAELAGDSELSEFGARLTLLRMQQADLVVPVGEGERRSPRKAFGRAGEAAAAPAAGPQPAAGSVRSAAAPRPDVDLEPPRAASPARPVAPPRAAARPQPRPAAAPARRPPLEAPGWLAPSMAVGLVAALLLLVLVSPHRLLLPFPWHSSLRAALETDHRTAALVQIDRAARAFFLLDGRFPDSLQELETAGLLAPAGGTARGVTVAATPLSLSVQSGPDGPARTTGIAGDFLLDPEFRTGARAQEPPLVLLD